MDILRSLMFVPGNSEKMLTKAIGLENLDVAMFDLEDGTPVAQKDAARGLVADDAGPARGRPAPLRPHQRHRDRSHGSRPARRRAARARRARASEGRARRRGRPRRPPARRAGARRGPALRERRLDRRRRELPSAFSTRRPSPRRPHEWWV